MNQTTAYKVLGLENHATIDEIKAAYAELSKKYHPEENPEEFQQIHEAYKMLVRGSRSRRQHVNTENNEFQTRSNKQTDTSFGDTKFLNDKISDEEFSDEADNIPQYDFDAAEKPVQQEIPEELLIELQKAMDKLDEIVPILNDKAINPNILKAQLEKQRIDILLCPSFVNKLYSILYDREVDLDSYKIIVEHLRLWDEVLLQEREDLMVLKVLIDEKKEDYCTPEKMHKRIISGFVFIGILFGILILYCEFF